MRLDKGHLVARLATTPGDIVRAQELRHICFFAARGLSRPGGRDRDDFDDRCRHVLIEDAGGRLLACFRVMVLPAARIAESYSAQFYDLAALSRYPHPILELGRFCSHPAAQDPDLLRLAWAAITGLVDGDGAGLLFGCTSFAGADAGLHRVALAHLAAHHLAPSAWAPRAKGLALALPTGAVDARAALSAMPPLLRSYIGMGGWVSDHAVIDLAMDTVHVFTALEVARIPAARARALRALAS